MVIIQDTLSYDIHSNLKQFNLETCLDQKYADRRFLQVESLPTLDWFLRADREDQIIIGYEFIILGEIEWLLNQSFWCDM